MAYRLAPGACALALVAAMAFARPATGAELRLMKPDDVTAASPCIGNPVTPLCAAETAEACERGGIKSLCDAVGRPIGGRSMDPRFFGPPIGTNLLYQYRFEYVDEKVLGDQDIPDWARSLGSESWKPGDVALRLWWQRCPFDDDCFKAMRSNPNWTARMQCRTLATCRRQPTPYTYILRRQGDRWMFVDRDLQDPLPRSFWEGR